MGLQIAAGGAGDGPKANLTSLYVLYLTEIVLFEALIGFAKPL